MLYKCAPWVLSGTGLSASLAPPALDHDLSVSERLESVKACLHGLPAAQEGGVVITYDIIKVYKALVWSCGVSLERKCEDPKVRVQTRACAD